VTGSETTVAVPWAVVELPLESTDAAAGSGA
jgi:hypothetical protein